MSGFTESTIVNSVKPLSLSKNFQNTPVSGIIEETGV